MNYELLYEKFPVLEYEDIVLKKIEEEDAEDLFLIHSSTEVHQYIPGKAKNNLKTVTNMIGHYERDFSKKKMIFLGIYEKEKLVGLAEIFDIDKKTDMVTIGYRLNPKFWGRGIAGKTTKIMVNYLFNEIDVNRIQAFVMTQNEKSKSVLRKNLFVHEGTIREGQFWKDKGVVDLELYSLLKSDMV